MAEKNGKYCTSEKRLNLDARLNSVRALSFDYHEKLSRYGKKLEMATKWRKMSLKAGFDLDFQEQIDGGVELRQNLNDIEPELFIKFVRIPSLKTYSSLITKLQCCSKEWLEEFLVLGGLASLFDVLGRLSQRSLAKFSDVFLQLECVRCIKAVMNNATGLEFMVNDSSLTKQLAMGR